MHVKSHENDVLNKTELKEKISVWFVLFCFFFLNFCGVISPLDTKHKPTIFEP